MGKLEELEKRLAALEEAFAALRQALLFPPPREDPAERAERLLGEAKNSEAACSEALDQAFAAMGITGEPPGIEKLRAMMLEAGINPNDNAFSREIRAAQEK